MRAAENSTRPERDTAFAFDTLLAAVQIGSVASPGISVSCPGIDTEVHLGAAVRTGRAIQITRKQSETLAQV